MSAKRAVVARRPFDVGATAIAAVCALALFSGWGAVVHSAAVDRAALVLGIAGIVAAVVLALQPQAAVGVSRLALAWGAFLAWAAMCVLTSGRMWSALVGEDTNLLGLLTLVSFSAVALCASRIQEAALRRTLAWGATGLVAVQVIFAIGQLATGRTPAGSLPNSTYLGEALVLLLPLMFADDAYSRRAVTIARYALATVATVVLAASGSRVAAAVAIAWLGCQVLTRAPLSRTVRGVLVVAVVSAALGGGLLFARAELLGTLESTSVGQRPEMWRIATTAALDRPLTGYGPDGFIAGGVTVTTPEVARAGKVLVFAPGKTDPHNIAVWTLVSAGFVGLVLFVWAAIELVLRWRVRHAGGVDIAPYAWAVAGSFAVFLTAPVTLHVVGLLGLVVGASVGKDAVDETSTRRSHVEPVAPSESRWSPPAALANAAVFAVPILLVICGLLLAVNTGMRLRFEDHNATVSPAKAPAAQQASDLWALDPHLAKLASFHWGWAVKQDAALLAAQPDLAAIRRAVAVDTRDPFVALELVRTLRFYGAPDAQLETAFEETFDRWSLYPTARAEYAIFLAQRGRSAEAREQLAIAELVDPGDDADLVAAIAEAKRVLGE